MFDILETSVIIAVIIAIGSEVLTMFYSIYNSIREMCKKKKEQKVMKEKLEKRKQSKIDKA
jgi:predicted membrane protein